MLFCICNGSVSFWPKCNYIGLQSLTSWLTTSPLLPSHIILSSINGPNISMWSSIISELCWMLVRLVFNMFLLRNKPLTVSLSCWDLWLLSSSVVFWESKPWRLRGNKRDSVGALSHFIFPRRFWVVLPRLACTALIQYRPASKAILRGNVVIWGWCRSGTKRNHRN